MISYAPLWDTLKEKGETTYTLITRHHIDRRTIFKLKHDQSVTAITLEKICIALDCPVEKVLRITSDPTE